MPVNWRKAGSDLAINLESPGPHGTYSPGDIIVGHVARAQHVVSPRACVTVWLSGRAKTRVQVQKGENTSEYRSRFQLIDEQRSLQKIYDGPLHIASGGKPISWPFAVTIPTHVPSQLTKMQESSYLPLDRDAVAQQKLPSSKLVYGDKCDAYVEYWVEASLQIEGNGETRGTIGAKSPFKLQNYHIGPPISNFDLKMHHQTRYVASQRLVPGMEKAELSLRDKMKKFYQTSSVPKFYFQIEIGFPGIIQLDPPDLPEHARPITVMMRVTPAWKNTSQTLQGVRQEARLTTFQLMLESTTEARADGSSKTYTETAEHKASLVTPSIRSSLKEAPVYFSCMAESPFLNIGELLNLRIGYNGPPGHQRSLYVNIFPSAETYNIRSKHRLAWEVGVTIADETAVVEGSSPVCIVDSLDPRQCREAYAAPTTQDERGDDSWNQPPPDYDLPPTFDQVNNPNS